MKSSVDEEEGRLRLWCGGARTPFGDSLKASHSTVLALLSRSLSWMAAPAALLAAFLAARALLHAPSNAAADPHATLAPDAGLCLSPGVSAILELELELPATRDAASHRPCVPLLDAHDLTICCSSIQSLPEALEGATCAGGVAPIGESFAPLARASDEVERRRHGAAQQSELAHLTRHLMVVARDALAAVQLSDTGAGVAASSSILSRRLTWLSDAYHVARSTAASRLLPAAR